MLGASRGLYRPASFSLHALHRKIISDNKRISFQRTTQIYSCDFSGSMRISSQLYSPRIPQNYKFQTLPLQRSCRSPLTVWRRETDKEISRHPSTKGDENGRRGTSMAVAAATVPAAFQSCRTVCIFSQDHAGLLMPSLHQRHSCNCGDGRQMSMLSEDVLMLSLGCWPGQCCVNVTEVHQLLL